MASKIKLLNENGKALELSSGSISVNKKLEPTDFKYIRDTIKDMLELDGKLEDGDIIFLKGYHIVNDGGGGTFVYNANGDKSTHNGGTIIDPSKTFPEDWANQTELNDWFNNTNTGNGVLERIYNGSVNVRWFGTKGDGITDDTLAIQKSFNLSYYIFIPDGNYKITSSLVIHNNGSNSTGVVIFGVGEKTNIILNGSINGLVDTGSTYTRVNIRDLSISGDSTTLKGIYFTGIVYESKFENLYIYTGDDAIRLKDNFNVTFINCHVSSHNGHGFHLDGGNTTTLIGCYAHNFNETLEVAGYRIYGEATLVGCTGVDSGNYWGIFGANTTEDGFNSISKVTIVGCHAEDYKKAAVRFKYNCQVKIDNFFLLAPPSGTLESHFIIDYNDSTSPIDLSTVRFGTKGATVTYNVKGKCQVYGIDSMFDGTNILKTTTINTQHTYLNNKLSYNNLHIGNAWIDFMEEQTEFKQGLKSTGGSILFTNLPTSDPGVAGQLWNDNGTLKVSAG